MMIQSLKAGAVSTVDDKVAPELPARGLKDIKVHKWATAIDGRIIRDLHSMSAILRQSIIILS